MKRITCLLLAIVILLSVVLPITVMAEPAPHLTDIQFIGVSCSGNNMTWEEITPNQLSAKNPMYGETGYISFLVMGTGINMQIYNNSTNITNVVSDALPAEYITDDFGIVIGYIYYKEFPLSAVTLGGDFSVKMWDYNDGTSKEDLLSINVVPGPPSKPTNLSLHAKTDSISINWNKSSNNASYILEKTKSGDTSNVCYNGSSNSYLDFDLLATTNLTDIMEGLESSTTYTIKVKATLESNPSCWLSKLYMY